MTVPESTNPPELPGQPADLYPLSAFYALANRPELASRVQAADHIPQPYRDLLAHNRDMTSVLAAFHGGPISLLTLAYTQKDDQIRREVVLCSPGDAAVEYGAIEIHLKMLPEAARAEIIASRVPLGALLHKYGIQYRSRPLCLFQIISDSYIATALHSPPAAVLYGRRNTLKLSGGQVLADVVEILPLMKSA